MRKIGMAVAFAAATVSLMGVASAGGEDGVVMACHDRHGNLRVQVDDECPRRWTPLQWSVTGPQGPSGPQGAPGLVGPAGPQGPAGPTGPVEARLARAEGPIELPLGASDVEVASVDLGAAGTWVLMAQLDVEAVPAGTEADGHCMISPASGDVVDFHLSGATPGEETVTMLDTWSGPGLPIGVYCSAAQHPLTITRVDLVATRVDSGA